MTARSPRHVPCAGVPRLQEAQRPRVVVTSPQVCVETDGADGARLRFDFDIYQAVRVRSIDLYMPRGPEFVPYTVVEVEHSRWIEELRADLAQVDATADFLDRSHHWTLHAGDDVVEVVAWTMTWAPIDSPAAR